MTKAQQRLLVLALSFCTFAAAATTTLLGGGIETRTNVQEWANLALNVANVHELMQSGDSVTAKLLYSEAAPPQRSLRSLSVELKGTKTPNYIYQLQGLSDLGFHNVALYGDSFVQSSISKSNRRRIVSPAILVLIEWMYATHLLYQGVDKCQKKSVADLPDVIELGGGGMDEFMALWMGPNQPSGMIHEHTLYTLTQEAGAMFGKSNPEARVNAQLRLLYKEGSGILAANHACLKRNQNSVPELWNVVQRMVTQMTIPLVQMLIRSLIERNSEQAAIYALAVVPQVSQCRPSLFQRLKDELLERDFNFGNLPEILDDLTLALDCLGIACQEVGIYLADDMWQCNNDRHASPSFPLADYTATTRVKAQTRIDLDVYQLGILTSNESFDFAKLLYRFGQNAFMKRTHQNDSYTVKSLHELATLPSRQLAEPFYSYFTEYHDDPRYADNLVMNTLSGTGKWGSEDEFGSTLRRTEVVVKTCAFHILYLYALTEMATVVQDCNDGKVNEHLWDAAAAYLIGSLEGSSSNSGDGVLFWNLANKRAFEFNTVNSRGYAKVNSELENLLFAGKGELEALACDRLEWTVEKLQNLLLVPLIQSTLKFASVIQENNGDAPNDGLATGETFALSVLPIVAAYDRDAASVIERNMVVSPDGKPVRDGPQAVADAFNGALADVVDCRRLGELPPYVHYCIQATSDSRFVQQTWFLVTVSLLSVCIVCNVLLFCTLRALRSRKTYSETDTVGSETLEMLSSSAEIL